MTTAEKDEEIIQTIWLKNDTHLHTKRLLAACYFSILLPVKEAMYVQLYSSASNNVGRNLYFL